MERSTELGEVYMANVDTGLFTSVLGPRVMLWCECMLWFPVHTSAGVHDFRMELFSYLALASCEEQGQHSFLPFFFQRKEVGDWEWRGVCWGSCDDSSLPPPIPVPCGKLLQLPPSASLWWPLSEKPELMGKSISSVWWDLGEEVVCLLPSSWAYFWAHISR